MLWIALNLPQLPLDTVLRSQPRQAAQGAGSDTRKVAGNGAGRQAGTGIDADAGADAGTPGMVAPVVVTQKKRVGWCNPAALDAGIRIGMSEANAWSMAADLQVYPRDLLRERQALEEAALWALHFTPQVALQLPVPAYGALQNCGLLAEVAPSLRLFGGLQTLQARLARGIAELGLQACWATAPTATAAWLLAQAAPLTTLDATHVRLGWQPSSQADAGVTAIAALLDALPLDVMACAREHLPTLTGIGCTTLGALRRLPRGGLARRFGKALLTELDRAYGEQPEVHRWFEAPDTLDLKLELPARVDNTEALLFASRRLLLQLTGWLSARHAAVAGITLWLHHEPARKRDAAGVLGANSASSTPVAILLAAPSRDADHLGLLLRERLGQTTLIAPVVEIALVADQVARQAAPNTELFPTLANDAESIGRLVERLQSRLGTEAVRLLAISADHRPERSHATCIMGNARQRKSPVRRELNRTDSNAGHGAGHGMNHGVVHGMGHGAGPGASPGAGPGMDPDTGFMLPSASMRPGWLLPQPLALLTRQERPFYQSPLTLLAGPDRIEAGWWDDALALRDYFIAENDRHVLLWIFQLRPDGQGMDASWYLHGFFA